MPLQSDPLDAVTAAPQFHRVLLDNEVVRVLDTIVARGETVPLHTHCWPAVLYIVSWSDCVRRDAAGRILLDSRNVARPAAEAALWSVPLPPHTLENVGDSTLRVIAIEQKQAVAQG